MFTELKTCCDPQRCEWRPATPRQGSRVLACASSWLKGSAQSPDRLASGGGPASVAATGQASTHRIAVGWQHLPQSRRPSPNASAYCLGCSVCPPWVFGGIVYPSLRWHNTEFQLLSISHRCVYQRSGEWTAARAVVATLREARPSSRTSEATPSYPHCRLCLRACNACMHTNRVMHTSTKPGFRSGGGGKNRPLLCATLTRIAAVLPECTCHQCRSLATI